LIISYCASVASHQRAVSKASLLAFEEQVNFASQNRMLVFSAIAFFLVSIKNSSRTLRYRASLSRGFYLRKIRASAIDIYV